MIYALVTHTSAWVRGTVAAGRPHVLHGLSLWGALRIDPVLGWVLAMYSASWCGPIASGPAICAWITVALLAICLFFYILLWVRPIRGIW